VPTYALWVGLGIVAAWWVRRLEVSRLGHQRWPGYHWVPVGALVGAVLGAKLGMLLFEPPGAFAETLGRVLSLDFTGKTILGGLAGGYLGVELAKKAVGIEVSTGDAFAVAVPLAHGIGRMGCLFEGCCYGAVWDGAWAVELHGAARHPVQLYEAGALLVIAGLSWALRHRPWPAGQRFKAYLLAYALLRFGLDALRGDPGVQWGPLSAVQWACLAGAGLMGLGMWRAARPSASPTQGA